MKTKKVRTLGLVILATLAAVAARGQSAASGAPGDEGGLCLARLAAPMSTAGPVCGSCSGQCRSDGLCKGKLAGDDCNASGGTCQIVGGCGMFDCCRCTSAFVAFTPADERRSPPERRYRPRSGQDRPGRSRRPGNAVQAPGQRSASISMPAEVPARDRAVKGPAPSRYLRPHQ